MPKLKRIKKVREAGVERASRSTSHCGYDNEAPTMNSLLKRILAKAQSKPITNKVMQGLSIANFIRPFFSTAVIGFFFNSIRVLSFMRLGLFMIFSSFFTACVSSKGRVEVVGTVIPVESSEHSTTYAVFGFGIFRISHMEGVTPIVITDQFNIGVSGSNEEISAGISMKTKTTVENPELANAIVEVEKQPFRKTKLRIETINNDK